MDACEDLGRNKDGLLTLEIDVGWPVPLDMRDRAFAPTVETGVVGGAYTGVCGVQAVECGRKRRQAGDCLAWAATFALEGGSGRVARSIVGLGV